MLKVHLLHPPDPSAQPALLDALSKEVSLSYGPDLPDPPDYQVLVAGRPERAHLMASANLRALIIPFAGIPDHTRQLLREFPEIAAHNLHHNAAPTAELALALLLAAAKFLIPFDRALRRNDWSPRYAPNPSLSLEGKTALVLGYGAIGQRLARACLALSMQVMAIRRHPHKTAGWAGEVAVYGPEALHNLLAQAQVLLIALPATTETEGLIGEHELRRMPAGGVLVNVGRGTIVDQAALYHALKEGWLAAAGLDVWYHYPTDPAEPSNTPPADYPFHELENVVMSPHRGGASNESEIARMAQLAVLLNAAADNQPIPNRIDLDAGY